MMTQTQRAMAAAKPTTPKSAKQQTFLEHLRELRLRLFGVALIMVIGCLLGYTFHDQIIHILLQPLHGEKLVYLTPGGGFDFIFKVSLYVGVALAIPVTIYQIYRYLEPLMIRPRTKRYTAFIVLLSCALALGGTLFGFFVALPAALNFLTGFAGDYIQANLTASSYLGFVMAYLLGLAALFQLPLILLFVNSISGPLKPSKLLASEQYVLLGSFILAAIITPTPDIVNQSIVAGPVIAVYQLGLGLVLFQNRTVRTARQAPKVPVAPTESKAQGLTFVVPGKQAKQSATLAQSVSSRPKAVQQPTPMLPKKAASPLALPTAPRPQRRPSLDGMTVKPVVRTARPLPKAPPRPSASRPRPVGPATVRPRQVIDGVF